MAARNLLHINRLEDFKAWLDSQGIEHRPGRGHYEVLQVQVVKPFWCVIYRRDHMPEHLTVPENLRRTITRFIIDEFRIAAAELKAEEAAGAQEETTPCPNLPPWMS